MRLHFVGRWDGGHVTYCKDLLWLECYFPPGPSDKCSPFACFVMEYCLYGIDLYCMVYRIDNKGNEGSKPIQLSE